jgi:hypothetical protein
MKELNKSEREELSKLRDQRKRAQNYRNQYAKENYKRIICMLPIERVDLFEEAKGDTPTSTYICDLIYADMRKKGLL